MNKVQVEFEDGTVRQVHEHQAPFVVGLSVSGHVMVLREGCTFSISECCGASGKGSESGIVCRKCYYPVDGALGYEDETDLEVKVVGRASRFSWDGGDIVILKKGG